MKNIRLYNTLTRKKENFKPLHHKRVGLYTCGPTVYNYAHLGNLRTYIFEDILRRTLEYAGYKVRQVMNITDIEDKIFRDAKKEGKTIFEFIKPYEKAFFEDLQKLNIEKAWKYPKATEHLPEMIKFIQVLIKKRIAYRMAGSVYFSISKFKPYGKLSRVKGRELKAGARIDADEYTKENIQDFALWKAPKPGEPIWKTPFGEGHPGWHIECSVMSMKYLGKTFDMHTGGVDNIFPHHENEIAQSEAATGNPFVRYWVHGEFLLVDNQKMSKSLGNFYTLRDIKSRGFSPLAFRYLTLTSHYRSKLNFTWESLRAAQVSLERLYGFVRDFKIQKRPNLYSRDYRGSASIVRAKKDFAKAVFNDLDTPKALAAVWNLVSAYNKKSEAYNPGEVLKLLYDFDRMLGLGLKNIKHEKIPAEIKKLALRREQSRKTKNWNQADELRKKIVHQGYEVKDTPAGPKITRRPGSLSS
jgi:cysteinyl-tRNA synthetase